MRIVMFAFVFGAMAAGALLVWFIGRRLSKQLGGVSIVVFGLIAVTGARIWVVNKVDFSDNRNLIVAAVTLVLGTGDFTLKLGGFTLGGIGTATFGAIILYAVLRRRESGVI